MIGLGRRRWDWGKTQISSYLYDPCGVRTAGGSGSIHNSLNRSGFVSALHIPMHYPVCYPSNQNASWPRHGWSTNRTNLQRHTGRTDAPVPTFLPMIGPDPPGPIRRLGLSRASGTARHSEQGGAESVTAGSDRRAGGRGGGTGRPPPP